MALVTDTVAVSTRGDGQMLDITEDVQAVVGRHGFHEGAALVFVSGSTAGLTTVEYEPGLLEDIPAAFERLAPRDMRYKHEDTWHDGNGHSHVRASILGPSLHDPVSPEPSSPRHLAADRAHRLRQPAAEARRGRATHG